MVQVSDKFRQLATDNGRHVYCRIEADGEVFLDDRLIEFTLDDVTHPDWFTVGSACANRFHFVARFDGELASGALVKPFVSFDNEEWCSLGTFYISRRYVRGSIISVTAYDRMYTLDTELTTALAMPCTSDELLREICDTHGIELPDGGSAFEVTSIPQDCTVRDMIGYIAGLNKACAKFDRDGRLILRSCTQYDEHISHLNCMEIHRNMTRSKVSCLIAETDSGTLVSGDGAVIDTVEMYNPLMTQDILDQMYSLFKPFSYYGADIVMQGLPYLESGEALYLLDGDMLYPLVISEMELHYDGGLTGYIYSRNRTVADSPVTADDLEQALKRLSAAAYRLSNDAQIQVGAQPVTIAEFSCNAAKQGFAQLDVSISASESTADFVLLRVLVNGAEADRSVVHNMEQGTGRHLLHLSHLELFQADGGCTVQVTAQTGNGEFYILPDAMQASLVVHGAGNDSGCAGGTSQLYDYAMLSDTSARCNGIVYDIAKDSATGLITKISDSLGNVLYPERADSITDTATHNAVVWAVAMAKGIRASADALPVFNYGGVRGFNAPFGTYVYHGDADTLQITDSAITLREQHSGSMYYNHNLVLTAPIPNPHFSRLRLTVQVSGHIAVFNNSAVTVAKGVAPDEIGPYVGQGLSDIVLSRWFTMYNDASVAPNSDLPLTTVDIDISDTVGGSVYLGFNHNCNTFSIHSIALLK